MDHWFVPLFVLFALRLEVIVSKQSVIISLEKSGSSVTLLWRGAAVVYVEIRVTVKTAWMNYSSRNMFKTNPYPATIMSPGEGIPFWDSTCYHDKALCLRRKKKQLLPWAFGPSEMNSFGNLRKTLWGRSIHAFLFREKYNTAVFKEAHFCVCCVADGEKWAVLEELYQLSGFPGSCTTLESFW